MGPNEWRLDDVQHYDTGSFDCYESSGQSLKFIYLFIYGKLFIAAEVHMSLL